MKTLLSPVLGLLLTALCGSILAGPKPSPAPADLEVSGPYVHENLTVFLLHGNEELPDAPILTLGEAIEKKFVTVTETGDVNQLMIENHSGDCFVYIHPGDIIKGGKQDRTLPNGFLLTRNSGKIPVDSFCVEQGRWAQRSGEAVDHFAGNSKALASKDLKLASKLTKSQGAVWEKVAAAQDKLSRNVGADVKAAASASSYQLTLENKELEKTIAAYVKAIDKETEQKAESAIGMAFAINGEFNSADVFASRELFGKLWPKLLESAATEAIGEKDQKPEGESAPSSLDKEKVVALIEESATGKEDREEVAGKNFLLRHESDRSVSFETYADGVASEKSGPKRLHWNVIGWEEEDRKALAGEAVPQRRSAPVSRESLPSTPAANDAEAVQEPQPESKTQRRGFFRSLFGR